jgi:hypothetical protein
MECDLGSSERMKVELCQHCILDWVAFIAQGDGIQVGSSALQEILLTLAPSDARELMQAVMRRLENGGRK